ncbi:MAG: glycosyltransferase family 4 protein, partial [candidate division WOR-3 bacterium]
NIKVIRVKLPYVERGNLIRRGVEQFEIAWKLYFYGKKYIDQVDVILVYSPPLTLYWTAKKIRQNFGAPFILNIQDLFPQAAVDLGVMKHKVVINFFRWLEKNAYNSADIITVHSEGNAEFVQKIIGSQKKIVVIENWVDKDEVRPGSKINEFSTKYSLTDKFVVSYAGTFGFSQDVEIVLKAANDLKAFDDIVFLFVGDGVKLDEAKTMATELGLKNVLFLPPVPREKYPLVLHSSDVSLATLTKDVKTPVVPSKILSIMSSGIPIIVSMNLDGDAPKLIERAKAGFCVGAGDHKALAERILELYKNPALKELLGKNGRKYIEEQLSVQRAAELYENLFFQLIHKGG